MTPPIRVLVADDQALLRGSFRVLLETSGMDVVGEAGTGVEAIRVAGQTRPDVILMDVRMPDMDGIAATREITATSAARVIILTMFDLDAYVFAALRAGASGFLLKDAEPAEVLRAVEVVAAGEALLAPAVTRRLIEEFARAAPPDLAPPAELTGVTAREREVLVLIARGLSNAEIGDRLYVGQTTVKTHIGHLLAKLHVTTRAQLVMLAYESGLVERRARR
ncbi:response regulator transcription factor [Dactylosporangium sp. AC04546]|uniref:response regulator n=1 Tax=Dactylosporangium sp. AC04546 TaxID=2862460 RepID=UPI001EDD5F39|nr:response regulator transcription factor [Dactylosporangium sp. AC04546]WVK79125.1 response regulator transcription factor [Dactylosporangium sp. AC04546]